MSDQKDFVVDDANVHLAASKNNDYRTRVKQRFSAVIHFLQNNGLTTRKLLADSDEVTSDLKILRSDLTDTGFRVMEVAYDKWLRGINKGKRIDDLSILIKALADSSVQA